MSLTSFIDDDIIELRRTRGASEWNKNYTLTSARFVHVVDVWEMNIHEKILQNKQTEKRVQDVEIMTWSRGNSEMPVEWRLTRTAATFFILYRNSLARLAMLTSVTLE